jgi:hypothetical protein
MARRSREFQSEQCHQAEYHALPNRPAPQRGSRPVLEQCRDAYDERDLGSQEPEQ